MKAGQCPFQDICATTQFWRREKREFIAAVCDTNEYVNCKHFMGLEANSSWVTQARDQISFEAEAPKQ